MIIYSIGSKLITFFGAGFAFGGIILYIGNLFLVPSLGLNYFLAIIAGINLSSIVIAYTCLPQFGHELENIINQITGTYTQKATAALYL